MGTDAFSSTGSRAALLDRCRETQTAEIGPERSRSWVETTSAGRDCDGRAIAISHSKNSLLVVLSIGLAVALVSLGLSSVAQGRDSNAEGMDDLLLSSGFASDLENLAEVPSLKKLDFGTVVVDLPTDSDGKALANDGVTLNGPIAGTSDELVVAGSAFGVVTETHGEVEYRFDLELMPGSTFVERADGSLDQIQQSTGLVLGGFGAAYAIDEIGTSHPASYSYDAVTQQLVMKADLTSAVGMVLIDPPWRGWDCVVSFGLLGYAFFSGAAAIAAAPWTGGLSAWMGFAMWQGASVWGAYQLGLACRD